jgi:hypothetical protein
MNLEYWWEKTGTGNTEYSEKNESQSRFVHHKSHMAELGLNPALLDEGPLKLKKKGKAPHKEQDNFNTHDTDSLDLLRHTNCPHKAVLSHVKCCVTGSFIRYQRLGFNTKQR